MGNVDSRPAGVGCQHLQAVGLNPTRTRFNDDAGFVIPRGKLNAAQGQSDVRINAVHRIDVQPTTTHPHRDAVPRRAGTNVPDQVLRVVVVGKSGECPVIRHAAATTGDANGDISGRTSECYVGTSLQ